MISGTHRPLGFYLKRYPEAETQVAAEYLRRRAATDEEAGREAQELYGERIGRYRIVGALGQGGQGMVYEAVDDRLGRRVALKLLQGRLVTETRRRRFQREAETLARIEHHAIAEVLDADFDGDEPFIAMRFIPGTDLAAQIRSSRAQAATALPVTPSNLPELHKVLRFFEGAFDTAHRMCGPPRREAGQPDGPAGWGARGARLRARDGLRRRGPDPRGRGTRHARVHGPRADRGGPRPRGRAHGRLRPRRLPLRSPRGHTTLPGRQPPRDPGLHPAGHAAPRGPRPPGAGQQRRRRGRSGHGPGPRPPLRGRPRLRRGPASPAEVRRSWPGRRATPSA